MFIVSDRESFVNVGTMKKHFSGYILLSKVCKDGINHLSGRKGLIGATAKSKNLIP